MKLYTVPPVKLDRFEDIGRERGEGPKGQPERGIHPASALERSLMVDLRAEVEAD